MCWGRRWFRRRGISWRSIRSSSGCLSRRSRICLGLRLTRIQSWRVFTLGRSFCLSWCLRDTLLLWLDWTLWLIEDWLGLWRDDLDWWDSGLFILPFFLSCVWLILALLVWLRGFMGIFISRKWLRMQAKNLLLDN